MTTRFDIPSRTSDTPSSDPQFDETAELSPDDIFHVLQTNRRREAIRYLLDEDELTKMRDVAEHVAAKEHETTVAQLTSAQRQRVYIPLYQSHLPKLDKKGIIEYDQPRGSCDRPIDWRYSDRISRRRTTNSSDREPTPIDRPLPASRARISGLRSSRAVVFCSSQQWACSRSPDRFSERSS